MVFEELKQLAAQSECPEMQRFPGTLAQFADESVESVVIMCIIIIPINTTYP